MGGGEGIPALPSPYGAAMLYNLSFGSPATVIVGDRRRVAVLAELSKSSGHTKGARSTAGKILREKSRASGSRKPTLKNPMGIRMRDAHPPMGPIAHEVATWPVKDLLPEAASTSQAPAAGGPAL